MPNNFFLGTLLAACLLFLHTPVIAKTLLVPAYFSPAKNSNNVVNQNAWEQLIHIASFTPIAVVINPSSGPAEQADADYRDVIQRLQANGATVLAYLPTNYGNSEINIIQADVTTYLNQYSLNGFFVDETTAEPDQINFYESLFAFIKQQDDDLAVFLNPGRNTDESYINAADVLITYENSNLGYSYENYTESNWMFNYTTNRFAHLIYDVSDTITALNYINNGKHAEYIYITNDSLNNPWDTLPSYLNDITLAIAPSYEVFEAKKVPEPSTLLLFLISLVALRYCKKKNTGYQ